MEQLQTPVAVIVFKRLDTTQKMFEAVRKARPKELFIIADGWRNEDEKAKCRAVREYLEGAIDWQCTVHANYSDENMGLKKRVVSGLNWVFSAVDRAIILEDDCVADQTFFRFCEELLEKYKNEPKVMQISAMNFQQENKGFSTKGASYYFSQFGEIWGWATWRRAWALNDVDMKAWPHAKKSGLLSSRIKDPAAVDYFEYRFDLVYNAKDDRKKSNVWGAQWHFAQLLHGGLSIVPNTNLISNIGVGEDATNKKSVDDVNKYNNMPTQPMIFPLIHPQNIESNEQADAFSLKEGFRIKRNWKEKVLFFLKRNAPPIHTTLKGLK